MKKFTVCFMFLTVFVAQRSLCFVVGPGRLSKQLIWLPHKPEEQFVTDAVSCLAVGGSGLSSLWVRDSDGLRVTTDSSSRVYQVLARNTTGESSFTSVLHFVGANSRDVGTYSCIAVEEGAEVDQIGYAVLDYSYGETDRLTAWEIAGIIVGGIAGVLLITALIVCTCRRRSRKPKTIVMKEKSRMERFCAWVTCQTEEEEESSEPERKVIDDDDEPGSYDTIIGNGKSKKRRRRSNDYEDSIGGVRVSEEEKEEEGSGFYVNLSLKRVGKSRDDKEKMEDEHKTSELKNDEDQVENVYDSFEEQPPPLPPKDSSPSVEKSRKKSDSDHEAIYDSLGDPPSPPRDKKPQDSMEEKSRDKGEDNEALVMDEPLYDTLGEDDQNYDDL